MNDLNDYVVTITEVLVKKVPIRTHNEQCARDAIMTGYNDEDIVLDYNDFQEVTFKVEKVEKTIDNN